MNLKLTHPQNLQGTLPSLELKTELKTGTGGTFLKIHFQVSAMKWNTQPSLPKNEPAWGLWETDVVEVFLAVRTDQTLPYYEFQLSPLGQHFELKILKPRVDTDRNFRSGFTHHVSAPKPDGAWSAEMMIPLENLGWDGKPASLVGGAFACLGPKDHRSYWSLYLPQQKNPDFHLPEYFGTLVSL